MTEVPADIGLESVARSIVLSLCGGRWVSPPVRFVDEYPLPRNGVVMLAGRPVVEIHSILIGDETVDPTHYTLSNGFVLRFGRETTARACSRRHKVEIEYTYGTEDLPPVVQNAVDTLAAELAAAEAGSNECRIPERVTSVNRQGMSWTLIDPQDFLQDGRTGIYEVDLAIKTVNPKNARRRARLFSGTSSAPPLRRKP